MFASHVRLCPQPIVWQDGPSSPTRIFYDSLHQQLVRLHDARLSVASPKLFSSWTHFLYLVPGADSVSSVKFHPAMDLVAILCSGAEVRILDAKTGQPLATRGPMAKNTVILAIHWVPNSNALFFVTSNGVELYSVAQEVRQTWAFRHVKSATHSNTVQHWYLDTTSTLMLVDSKGLFQSYKMRANNIFRICKFELEGTPAQNLPQISLVCLYNRVYCLYINEDKGQLFLLGLAKDSMKQTNVYDLYSPGKYAVSVVDNVLVVHNLAAKVALLFDVRNDPSLAVSAPLMVSSKAAYECERKRLHEVELKRMSKGKQATPSHLAAAPSSSVATASQSSSAAASDSQFGRESMKEMLEQTYHGVPTHYFEHWCFLDPNYILDSAGPSQGILWSLELDLPEIVATWPSSNRDKLIDFLLKRSAPEAKPLILLTLEQLVTADTSLSLLSRLFNMLNRICKAELESQAPRTQRLDSVGSVGSVGSAAAGNEREIVSSPPALSALGFVLIHQLDVYEHVFLKAKASTPVRTLIAIITEYMRSVYRFSLPSENAINELLIDLLIEDQRYYEFHQYLQYHILNDSLPVAKRLLLLGEAVYPPALQLAMDMLFRLNAFVDLLLLLLRRQEVLRALRLVSHRSPLFKESGLSPADFMEAALVCGSTDVFYATFKFFETRNLILRGSPVFISDDRCNKYVTHFNHLFGSG